jgi:hypothetical protein
MDDQVIELFAVARDLDLLGDDPDIVEYEWLINGQPFTYTDGDTDCYQDKQCKAPARVLAGSWDGSQFQNPGWSGDNSYNLGWYEFSVRAKDNEGQWSKIVKVKKYIATNAADAMPYGIFLPLTTK